MLTAFCMIQARPDAIKTIAMAIAALPHVSEVYSVTGEWDIIAIVRLADYEKLAEIIPDEISRIDGITKTSTVLAFRRFSPNDLEAAWSVGIEYSSTQRTQKTTHPSRSVWVVSFGGGAC